MKIQLLKLSFFILITVFALTTFAATYVGQGTVDIGGGSCSVVDVWQLDDGTYTAEVVANGTWVTVGGMQTCLTSVVLKASGDTMQSDAELISLYNTVLTAVKAGTAASFQIL